LTPLGFGVLTFDRRPWPNGADTPLEVQAQDAQHAVELLGTVTGGVLGLYGFSQGAWAASLAAADFQEVSALALVGCSGVSPAEQMRYYCDERLRRSGYSAADRGHLKALREAVEDVIRGGDRERAERLLASAVDRPWFELSYLPHTLPGPEDSWPDMDYDPAPAFSRVRCPTLLVYGADEECVPAEASKAVWLRAQQQSAGSRLTMVDLPGCGHFPAPGADGSSSDVAVSRFSVAYTESLRRWVSELAGP